MYSQRTKIILSFASIYLIWGSTYLAILYGLETIPPWVMTTVRFFLAGLIMWGLSTLKKERPLLPTEKNNAIISGTLMIIANGLVCVSEQWVSSGMAAVVIGAMPIWMMLVNWLGFKSERPAFTKWIGATLGFAGIFLIAFESPLSSGVTGHFSWPILVLIASNLIWATGTLVQRKMNGLKSPLAYTRAQMLAGAAASVLMCIVFESPWYINWLNVSWISMLAVAYLVVFGSVIAYTAYAWLARNVEPHKVSTYALVNPVIAVFLGWAFKNESISNQFIAATGLVLLGLAILFWKRKKQNLLK